MEVENTAEQKEQVEETEEVIDEEEEGRKKREGEQSSAPRVTLQQYRLGEIVTFSFSHFDKSGLPVRPKLQRRRTDVTWQDVVDNFRLGLPMKKSLSGILSPLLNFNFLTLFYFILFYFFIQFY